jgi:hypothetical protein
MITNSTAEDSSQSISFPSFHGISLFKLRFVPDKYNGFALLLYRLSGEFKRLFT